MSSESTGLGPQEHGPAFQRPNAGGQPAQQPWGAPADWAAGQQPYPQGAQNGPGQSGPGQGGPGQVPIDPRRPGGGYQPPKPEGPPKSKLPAILTAVVVGLVALIVVIGTVRANMTDRQSTASNSPTPTPTAVPSTSKDSITFSSSEGSGQLSVRSHRWITNAGSDPVHGQYLQLEVEIRATDGRISYGPQYFQTFDSSSDVFQTSEAGVRPPALTTGYLRPGESVKGGISFDMPRGPVTLLMSNSLLESVTALRIAD